MTLRRNKPLRRDGAGARRFADQRSRLAPVSKKRRAAMPDRERVRLAVIDRDRGCVVAAMGVPEAGPCGQRAGRAMLEVHEVIPRGRGGDWLDVDNCIALCPAHHDWVTNNPASAAEYGLVRSGAEIDRKRGNRP